MTAFQSCQGVWHYLWVFRVGFSKHRPSGLMLSISRNVRLSVGLSVRLFTFEVPFKCIFAPTSQSQMSNIFRDSEFLGKSNGKKWSQIWTLLFRSSLKFPQKNNNFWLILSDIFLDIFECLRFRWFFLFFKKNQLLGYSWFTLMWHWCYYLHRSRDALSPVCGIFFTPTFWHVGMFLHLCGRGVNVEATFMVAYF